MPVQLKIELTKEAQETLRAVQTLPEHILEGIAAAMDDQNQQTISHEQQNYLNFPKDEPPVAIGLRHMSGRLIHSVTASKAKVIGQAVQSSIGSNVVYAAVHEFGYEGEQQVSAHARHVASRDVYQIGERVPGKRAKRTLVQKGEVGVRAHTRHVNIPARAPIQHAIEDRADDYSRAISEAIGKVWEGGGK